MDAPHLGALDNHVCQTDRYDVRSDFLVVKRRTAGDYHRELHAKNDHGRQGMEIFGDEADHIDN